MNDYYLINLLECDSTNTYLKSHFEELKDKLPALVTTALQTGGRGREKRTWLSLKGKGLYSSFGFMLKTDQNINLLPLTVGISVIETLEKISGLEFGIKWPNDVIFNGKKAAGILIENIIMEDTIFCIAGIGINLNHKPADFPIELTDKAVSLKMAQNTVEDYRVEEVNSLLAATLSKWLEKMKRNSGKEIIEKANRLSAFLKDKTITFHTLPDNRIGRGIFKGIGRYGGMEFESEKDGMTTIYYSGEISLI
jgi:BirA family transcriptional regulator, biotin operon repressor / biotin---[acetyl-CoA-carboxylase] ligase